MAQLLLVLISDNYLKSAIAFFILGKGDTNRTFCQVCCFSCVVIPILFLSLVSITDDYCMNQLNSVDYE